MLFARKVSAVTSSNGARFLNFVLGFYGIKYNEIEAYEICKNLELNYEFLNQKISKFSKGMTQKLGLMAVFYQTLI